MVIVGGSFIGTEVAAYLANKAASVTIVCRTEVPLERTLGSRVGRYIMTLHQSKGQLFVYIFEKNDSCLFINLGVRFVVNATVTGFSASQPDGEDVAYVHVTHQNEPLPADLVVVIISSMIPRESK